MFYLNFFHWVFCLVLIISVVVKNVSFGIRMIRYGSDFFQSPFLYHLCDVGKLFNIPNSVSTSRYYKNSIPKKIKQIHFFKIPNLNF